MTDFTLDNILPSWSTENIGYQPSPIVEVEGVIQQLESDLIEVGAMQSEVFTWNGPATNGNPYDPANWLANGQVATRIPTQYDSEVFDTGGNIQLAVNTPFEFGTVVVTNKTSLSLTSGGTSALKTVVDPSSAIYATAPSGSISLGELHNRGIITASSPLVIGRITNWYNGVITAQNGLTVTVPYDQNQGVIEVWGGYSHDGTVYNTTASAVSDPAYHVGHDPKVSYSGSLVIHDSNYTCFADNTRVVLADGRIVKVACLAEGDVIAGSGTVTWLGRMLLKAGTPMIKLRNLTVTPDHLIKQNNVLVPAQECVGAREVKLENDSYVYHFQVDKGHTTVNANGVWADTMMYDPSREAMETVFGTLDKTLANWGHNTAMPLRKLGAIAA